MKTLAHLSDLHFGAETPAVVAGLAADLAARPPSLVVVSGDLTQRARRSQFAAARDFLARLPRPQLVVPGNHDVPLFDVVRRLLVPFARYRAHLGPQLDRVYRDDELVVLGLNTARAFTWKSGRISRRQIALLRDHLAAAGPRLKVIVTHHPFVPPPSDAGIKLVGRAALAIPLLDAFTVDLLLAGHLHHGYAADIRTHYPGTRHGILAVQAGTATSGRVRQEPNAYNWFTLESTRLTLEVRTWDGRVFAPLRVVRYARQAGGWEPVP